MNTIMSLWVFQVEIAPIGSYYLGEMGLSALTRSKDYNTGKDCQKAFNFLVNCSVPICHIRTLRPNAADVKRQSLVVVTTSDAFLCT